MAGIGPRPSIPSRPGGDSTGTDMALAATAMSPYNPAWQDHQLQQQVQRMTLGRQAYAQIGQTIAGQPEKYSDPALIQRVMQISKMTGLPSPITDKNGQQMIDPNMLTERPVATDADLQKLYAMPPGPLRQAFAQHYAGISQQDLDAPRYIAPTPGVMTAGEKFLDSMEQAVNEGRMTPQAFLQHLKSNRSQLEAEGKDLSGYFTPEYLNERVSAYADAQIQKMRDAGIATLENADTKKALEKDLKVKYGWEHDDRQAATRARIANAQASQQMAAIRIQQGWQKIQDAQVRANAQIQAGNRNAAVAILQGANRDYIALSNELTNAKIAIEKQQPLGGAAYDGLLQMLSLKDPSSTASQMQALAAQLNAGGVGVQNLANTQQSSMSGNPTQLTQPLVPNITINVPFPNAPGGGKAPQTSKGTIPWADIQQAAKKQGISPEKAARDAEAQGFTVQF